MARLNALPHSQPKTHEGGYGFGHMTPLQALRRSVMSCMLWEREFYENGVAIAERIEQLAAQVPPSDLAALAIEAREQSNLRHVPLLLLSVLVKTGAGTSLVSETIPRVIKRADEMPELLAIYWRKGKQPLSKQLKLGLAEAFKRFDGYALAKYNRAGAVRLRDVLFLTHAKPKDTEQGALWKSLIDGTLAPPDTWEVGLSAGGDKKETFERLLREEKLGYLALLRNLRNMAEAGVDTSLVRKAVLARKGADRVLPFRYVAAARAAPQFEPFIDQALSEAISDMPVLEGKTAVLVDVSGSMDFPLSERSDMKRIDAAAALASVINGDLRVFTFSNAVVEVPARRGMAGVDAVITSQPHGGTALGGAIEAIKREIIHDRLIVITDEQSRDRVPAPKVPNAYMINVASAQNGVGYGFWTHIDGFSESVLRFIGEHERSRT